MGWPERINELSNLPCCKTWRSIGTHIWFEFGVPHISLLRNGRRIIKGQATLHIVSDNWRIELNGACPLDSDTVTHQNYEQYGPRWFVDKPFPHFQYIDSALARLAFSPTTVIAVSASSYVTDDEDLSVRLPDESYWSFRFDRGWRKSE